MNKKYFIKILFLIVCCICIHHLRGQNFSYRLPQNIANQLSSISLNKENIALIAFDYDQENRISRNIVITKLNFEGEVLWSNSYPDLILRNHFISQTHLFIGPIKLLKENGMILSTGVFNADQQGYLLVLLSADGTPKWCNYIRHDITTFEPPTIIEASDGTIFSIQSIQNSSSTSTVSFQHYDLNGNLLYEKQLLDNNGSDMDLYKYHFIDEQRLAISKYDYSESLSTVSIYDNRLNFIEAFTIDLKVKNIIYDGHQFFISGEESLFALFSVAPKICCLSNDFDLQWAKATNLLSVSEYYDLSISNNQLFYKGFASSVNFIVRLDKSGETEKGLRLPKNFTSGISIPDDFEVGSNENFVYFAGEENSNDIFLNSVDASFRPTCVSANYCPEFTDIVLDINITSELFSPIDRELFVESFDMEVQAVEVTLEEGCVSTDNFDIVNPFFEVPDTICVNEPFTPSMLQNTEAESVSWDIPGSSLPLSSLFDPKEIIYTKAGAYLITQTILDNNCTSVFSDSIVVVPSIDTSGIQKRFSICLDDPFFIEPNIQNVDYLWLSDSSTEQNLFVDFPGNYMLELSNGYCKSTVNYVVSEISLADLDANLGEDTTVCKQNALLINPNVSPDIEFFWNDGSPELQRQITQTGVFNLTTSIDECRLENEIFVQVEDCSTQIYLPNAFSPNLDGINDDFYPLGNFFEVHSFRVFDRWGNLVHDEASEPWNGTFRNKAAPTGVYSFVLQIENTLLNEVEILKGDVVLVR